MPSARLGRTAVTILLTVLLTGWISPGSARVSTSNERQRIKQLVISEAQRMRFPAALALAVAHAESGFNPRARSHKGARGVMQIMPATSTGEYGIDPELLWRPKINIRLGIHFLKRLIRLYGGRTDLALSYYNGGSAVGAPGRRCPCPSMQPTSSNAERRALAHCCG